MEKLSIYKDTEIMSRLHYFKCNFAHNPAFIINNLKFSWENTYDSVCQYISYLSEQEIKKSSLIVLHIGQEFAGLSLFIASTSISKSVLLIPSIYPKQQVISFMETTGAEYCIGFVNDKVNIYAHKKNIQNNNEMETDEHVYLLTSGSTATPKCVQHKWTSLYHSIKINNKFIGKRWLCVYPVSSFAGMQVFLQTFLNGGCFVIPQDFTYISGQDVLVKHQIDYINCTPTYLRQLFSASRKVADHPIRCITLGGEIAEQSLLDLIKYYWPTTKIRHIYASTELGVLIEVTDEKEGFPLHYIDNQKFKIIDGVLYAKSSKDRAMFGYLGEKPLEKNSWVTTNDCVEIKGNRVFFIGRKDDIINVGGYKVNPATVEKVIRKLDAISDVIISSEKNPLSGNIIKACICLKYAIAEKNIRREIITICNKELPYYMQPRLFEFVTEIKKGYTQKLNRS